MFCEGGLEYSSRASRHLEKIQEIQKKFNHIVGKKNLKQSHNSKRFITSQTESTLSTKFFVTSDVPYYHDNNEEKKKGSLEELPEIIEGIKMTTPVDNQSIAAGKNNSLLFYTLVTYKLLFIQ